MIHTRVYTFSGVYVNVFFFKLKEHKKRFREKSLRTIVHGGGVARGMYLHTFGLFSQFE